MKPFFTKLWGLIQSSPILAIFVGEVIASLIADTKSIATLFGIPFAYLGVELLPGDTTPDILKILYWVLCTAIYYAVLMSLYRLFRLLIPQKVPPQQQPLVAPKLELYINEIATAMEVIERDDVTDDQSVAALEDLLSHVGDMILDSFKGIPLPKFRYAFLVGDDQDKFTMVSVGRRRTLVHHDMDAIDWVLTHFNGTHYLKGNLMQSVPRHDMEAIGLVRNQGTRLQFGFVIFIPKAEALTEEAVLKFYASVSAVQLITYMDKLMNIMVKYKVRMEGGRSS
ncbi:hypothetical protein [Tumebacillus permanentifrigoris]|uniref:Uncharacterized protein n=1 Tax=Tumebacillus permanentifrigoris TaxID=378543 RepID=A0A316D6R4_9BACL|nr:hypothetical protein [Tumebacillus permanentifrigoris]PWK09667.1 hypothetical protein C7459_113103 [Tumebacillus permanentifrigoris]